MNFPIFFFRSIQITILLTYLRSYDDKAHVCKSCLAPNEPLSNGIYLDARVAKHTYVYVYLIRVV